MRDISNKLHALVDEFVSNLSSDLDSLANNVSAQAHMYVKCDSSADATKGPRPTNRTTTEVLNGLKRPSGAHVGDSHPSPAKSNMEHAKPSFQAAKSRSRDNGRNSRQMKSNSASMGEKDGHNRARCVDTVHDNMTSGDDVHQGRGVNAISGKGKVVQTVELLSSDHSSDESLLPTLKFSQKVFGNQRARKVRNSISQGRPARIDMKSPSRSLESSHVMNYSYESDTKSVGGKSLEVETTFPKLKLARVCRGCT